MQTHTHRGVILAIALSVLALPLGAQTVKDQMLVSTLWVQGHSNSVNVLYVGDRAAYDAKHIPGALFVDASSLVVRLDGVPNELPPVGALENVFKTAGVSGRGRIVVYSNDPLLAARAWFTLDYLGQGDRSALLDGGLAKWVADGHATTSESTVVAPGSFEAHVAPDAVAHLATMRRLLSLRDDLGANVILIDARSPAQFAGEEAGPEVRRAGHMPGAINMPVGINFEVSGALHSAEQLRAIYERAGVSKDSANVVYCRTGMQASVTYFVLRYLGYHATLYDGSYVEWSNVGEPAEVTVRLDESSSDSRGVPAS